jgi:hypothetical protein
MSGSAGDIKRDFKWSFMPESTGALMHGIRLDNGNRFELGARLKRGLRLAVILGSAASAAMTAGCGSIGAAAGAIAGVTTGLVSSNPAIGIGVGIAVQAATDEAVNREMKSLHGDQQDAIAMAAGASTIDQPRPWSVKHPLPIENGHGEVRVLREFSSALATCKEFAFSVADGDEPDAHQDWFVASACKQVGGWKWASAEPAVARWGNLQ